jgi:hypothetical protein
MVFWSRSASVISFVHWLLMQIEVLYCQNKQCYLRMILKKFSYFQKYHHYLKALTTVNDMKIILSRSVSVISFFHWLLMQIEELYCQNAQCWLCMILNKLPYLQQYHHYLRALTTVNDMWIVLMVWISRSASVISFFHWLLMQIEELYCQNKQC